MLRVRAVAVDGLERDNNIFLVEVFQEDHLLIEVKWQEIAPV